MATKEDLDNLTKKLCEHFRFGYTFLNETLTSIFNADSKNEICRLQLISSNDPAQLLPSMIGLSFEIEVISTDAIIIFSKAKEIFSPTLLSNAFYRAFEGLYYDGLLAYIMAENDKENQTKAKTIHDLKVKQIGEWEMSQLERSGKLRIQ